ncbi:hypothetical protein [Microcoleus sp. CAWBG58]|uniref:hypothetical protein n=1 Tax=Microcoleus sp. CAWBG58 TaxID=2841651 RepID=UPI0025D47AAB|nr:hypothetical protein [Microcoleus sp. CAWBG58]
MPLIERTPYHHSFSHQSSFRKLSTVNCQLSTVNCQLSTLLLPTSIFNLLENIRIACGVPRRVNLCSNTSR